MTAAAPAHLARRAWTLPGERGAQGAPGGAAQLDTIALDPALRRGAGQVVDTHRGRHGVDQHPSVGKFGDFRKGTNESSRISLNSNNPVKRTCKSAKTTRQIFHFLLFSCARMSMIMYIEVNHGKSIYFKIKSNFQ